MSIYTHTVGSHPQTLALDAAKQAIEELGEGPNTALMYAAFGLVDAFILLAEESHVPVLEDLYSARRALQGILDTL